jgi:hypothetical protein
MTARRVLLLIAVFLLGTLAAAPASGDDYSRKHAIDARLQKVQAKLAWAERRQRTLSAELVSVNDRLRALSQQVGDVSARLATIESELALHQEKLDRLTELYRVETDRYLMLEHEYEIIVERLDDRLVELYEGGEPSTLEVVLSSRSFSELISSASTSTPFGRRTPVSPARSCPRRRRRKPNVSGRVSSARWSRPRRARSGSGRSRCAASSGRSSSRSTAWPRPAAAGARA